MPKVFRKNLYPIQVKQQIQRLSKYMFDNIAWITQERWKRNALEHEGA